jgi:thioredoxin-like negative regulator of GroEL
MRSAQTHASTTARTKGYTPGGHRMEVNAKSSERHTAPSSGDAIRPRLLFFYSTTSGRCRRVEAWMASILQRRHNHGAFTLCRIDADASSELARRFSIAEVPTILVVADKGVRARVEQPRTCSDLRDALEPWLR